jgi:hypothetical protein
MRLVAAGPYKANELARVSFELLPHGEFHVNQEYPFEMTLTGDPQTTLPKPKLEKGDAKVFGEKAAQFDVPLTITAAGEHKLQANVKFAVCTKENCVPDERNLALTVNVM